MLIVPFDPFTPFIKGVEMANDQNQQDIKFEQDRTSRELANADRQASNDLNASLAPFKVGAAQRADELARAGQGGALADITSRSKAAIDTADETYNTEVAKRETAGIKASYELDKAVLDFDAWNDGGRDLTAFKKSNDLVIGNVVETLRQVKGQQQTENLPALTALMKQQVDIATKVVANAVKTKDVNAIRDAMLIQDRLANVQKEVEVEVLKRTAAVATQGAAAQQAAANAAVAALPAVQQNTAAATASRASATQIATETLDRTAAAAADTQQKRATLTAASKYITGFTKILASPGAVPTEPTARATFYDSKAAELDEAYQTLQQNTAGQLPAGTVTGGGKGLFFEPIGESPVPLATFYAQYQQVFDFVPAPLVPPAPTARGKSPEQVKADVKLTEAKTAKEQANVLAIKTKKELADRRYGPGGAATTKKNPL